MSDYSKMKNAELEALLKERGLPHTGKKAEMVARLVEADKTATSAPATGAPTTSSKPAADEDEIDWDDDIDLTPAKAGEKAAPASAAPSAPEPTSEATKEEVAVKPSTAEPKTEATEKPVEEATTGEAAAEPAKPAVDFTRGLKDTTMEEEMEKRKARAKKFGMTEDDDEASKMLERAKKFGTTTDGPRGLNEALPERRERKRGREDGDAGGRGNDNKRRGGGRFNDRRGPNNRRQGGGGPGRTNDASGKKSTGGYPSWMTDTDRARADARKAKFG